MKDIKRKYLIIALSIVVIFIFAGTFAYWNWTSSENKNVVFNTSKALKDYITYDDGESKFVGDFQVSDSYLDGVHTTISMKKSDDVANITLMATINMDINAIGETMKVSPALKWVVTSGDSTNVGSILSSGNFVGTNAGDTMVLLPNIEVLTTVQQFTIWIWSDSSENPSADLAGETLDTVVWTQIDQVEGVVSTFSITKKNVTYQTINATVVNNMNKIVSYAVTTSNTEPSTWTSIDSTDQSNVYNLEYSVSATGKYYIWFKDSLGNVVSDNVSVSEIDTSAPVCTFGEFNPSSVADGETATVDLVCTDNDLKNINLSINDIEITGSSATLSNISKVKTANGYTYTISLMGTDVDGVVSLTLSSGKIFDSMNNTNESVSSGNLTIQNDAEAPTITLSANSDSSYSQTKSVTVTIKDTTSGLASGASLKYGWSTSTSTEPSSYTTVNPSYTAGTTSGVTFTASGSGLTGSYYLWVVSVSLSDVAGNSNTTTVKSTGTFKFDNAGPTITLSANSDSSYSQTKSVTVTIKDANSGLASGASLKYGWSTSTSTEPSSYTTVSPSYTEGTTSGVTFTASGSGLTGSYYLWVVSVSLSDVAGNSNTTTVKSTGTFKFDNAGPTITLSANSDSSYSQTKSVTVTIKDANSGLASGASLKYGWSTSTSTEPSSYTTVNPSYTAGTTSGVTFTASGSGLTGSYYLWVVPVSLSDVAGSSNTTTVKSTGTFKFDNAGPTITLSANSDSSYSQTKSVTVTIKDANSGLASGASLKYGWSTSTSTEPSSYTTVSPSYTEGTTSGVTFTASGSGLTGSYYLWVVPVSLSDVAGSSNTTTVKSTGTFKFDNAGPTITLSANSDSSYSQTKSVTVTIKDTTSGLASGVSLKYGWSTSTSTEPSSYTTVNPSYTAGTTSGVTFTASGSGLTGSYYLWVVPVSLSDVAGNSNTTTVKSTGTFKFDNTAPTGTISASMSGTNITATVSASDSHSGLSEYQYAIDTNSNCSTVGFTSSTSSSYTFSISSFTTYYVCVKLKDNAGNLSSVISTSIADTTPPTAPTTMSFVFGDWSDYTDASWTNKKVYAARSAGQSDVSLRGPSGSTDSESGVAKYQISSDGSTWVDYNYVYTDAMYYMDSEGTHYRYFRACDNAGNCGSSLKKTVKIDKTTPTVSYSVASGTYAPTKSVTVTASDSGGSGFNYMNVHVYKDGSIVSSKSVNSRTTSTYTVSLDSDGAWTIYAQVYDNAGNTQNQSPNNGSGWYYQQYTIYTTKNGAYFVNNRSSISNLSSSLVGGMYRFQGSASAVTNNYICFGTSSKSTCTGSPDYWMYRIIGVTSGGQIKVIKKTPLGGGSGNTYQWHNSNAYALWSGCSLYSNLNGSSFLTNTTYLPSGWSDKISTSNPWYFRSDNVAYGSTYMAYTGADMYTYETGSSSLTAKIGLISLHDYYLAAGDGISCGTSGSCTSSWIQFTQNSSSYATSSEWSMARRGYVSSGYYGIRISSNGYATDSSSLVTTYYIVRPVFYISSSVNITSGSGTSSDPYIIG